MVAYGVGFRAKLPEVASAASVANWPRSQCDRFRFDIPLAWKTEVENPHARVAAEGVLEWLVDLGCSEREVTRTRLFDVAKYAGFAFPLASAECTAFIAKFISLWLLWDDVHVESGVCRWRTQDAASLALSVPDSFSRFDRGWRMLFRELSTRRSPTWVSALCASMKEWDEAAATEARSFARFRRSGEMLSFEAQLALRTITIGMHPTILLLEDVYDRELEVDFHELPAIRRIERLSGKLVGLGNEIFGFGKDLAEGQPNLTSNLILGRGTSPPEAVAQLIDMHNEGVREFDELAGELASAEPGLDRWVRDLRFATLGFTIWESQAPRYTAHKVLFDGQVLEPTL